LVEEEEDEMEEFKEAVSSDSNDEPEATRTKPGGMAS